MINNLFKELSEIEQVEAIALGGSRAGENYDEKSDYDVYVSVIFIAAFTVCHFIYGLVNFILTF